MNFIHRTGRRFLSNGKIPCRIYRPCTFPFSLVFICSTMPTTGTAGVDTARKAMPGIAAVVEEWMRGKGKKR